jgi:hypothetical protein
LRAYAREAVAQASVDQVRGVLHWRIAQRLLTQQKFLLGHPDVVLDRARPNERDFYLSLAGQVLELIDRIERTDPPTLGELARYDQRKAITLARQRARLDAATQQHRLGVFRPTFDRVSETALCERCGAGVSITVGSAAISMSELLETECHPQTGVSRE